MSWHRLISPGSICRLSWLVESIAGPAGRLQRCVPAAQRRQTLGAICGFRRFKGTALMGSGKGIAGIDQQVVWRPMPRKGSDRSFLVGAYSYLLAVAAILGRQHQLFLNAIVVALRPAKIGAFFQLHDFRPVQQPPVAAARAFISGSSSTLLVLVVDDEPSGERSSPEHFFITALRAAAADAGKLSGQPSPGRRSPVRFAESARERPAPARRQKSTNYRIYQCNS